MSKMSSSLRVSFPPTLLNRVAGLRNWHTQVFAVISLLFLTACLGVSASAQTTLTVSRTNTQNWLLYNMNAIDNTLRSFVHGPATAPLGVGAAQISVRGTINYDNGACVPPATVYVDDSWVGTAPGTDPDGPGPATDFGCDSFATIQGGVDGVTAGGTVIVADGTYTENVTIITAMTLKGAQFGVDARGRVAAESIVIPAAPGTATFTVAFNGLITIDGFAFSGGTSGTQGCIYTSVGPNNNMQILNNRFSGYSTAAIWMNRGGSDITIDKNVLDGSNIAGSAQAIFGNGPQSYAGLWITNNDIINNTGRYGFFVDGNHNVGESATRAPSVSGNLFNNNLQGLNLGSRSFGVLGPPVLGTYGGTISNNTFSNNTANGIQAGIQHVLVTGNTFSNNAIDGLALTSFGNTGADRGAQNSLITGNTFTGNLARGLFFSGTQGVGLIATNRANFNRIVGNAVGVQYGGSVAAGNNATIDIENNWWGCNFGPGTGGAGCTGTTNGAVVFAGNTGILDADPWLTLTTAAVPNLIEVGGMSTITSKLTINSDGFDTSGFGSVPNTTPVSFVGTLGTVAPPSTTTTSGVAMTTFTAGIIPGGGGVATTIDGQTVNAPIGILPPTSAPANISGHVLNNVGAPLSGVTMTLLDTVLVENRTTLTDANGNYFFDAVLTGRQILVTPSKNGYTFDPSNRSFNHIAEVGNIDFVGTSSGQVRTIGSDFDGDGKADLSVFRPSDATWYTLLSSTGVMKAEQWGLGTDRIAPADYDGDHVTDIAVFRPSTGTWYIKQSSTTTLRAVNWGLAEDVITPADFDGDGQDDIAVWRPSTGTWYVIESHNGQSRTVNWGTGGDRPVAADYDGDGKADMAVWRPSNGTWYVIKSSDGTYQYTHWGIEEDRPVVGDYDGDHKSDLAVFRPTTATWYVKMSSDASINWRGHGTAADILTPGDYDGDGMTDRAVWRAGGDWNILRSTTNAPFTPHWGAAGDIPTTSAYVR